MRVLHIAQSPHAARPGAPQMPQQRMVNLSAYGRPGGAPSVPCVPLTALHSHVSGPQQAVAVHKLCHISITALAAEDSAEKLLSRLQGRVDESSLRTVLCTGPSPQSSPGLVQVQMGQARPPAGAASAPHQPWQILMQTGQLGPGGLPSQQGGPRPGTVMYSAPPGGAQQPPHSTGQSPVNIRLSNYSGDPLPSLLLSLLSTHAEDTIGPSDCLGADHHCEHPSRMPISRQVPRR